MSDATASDLAKRGASRIGCGPQPISIARKISSDDVGIKQVKLNEGIGFERIGGGIPLSPVGCSRVGTLVGE